MKKQIILAVLLAFISVSLIGCNNTINGLGRDMKKNGEYITDAMKDDGR